MQYRTSKRGSYRGLSCTSKCSWECSTWNLNWFFRNHLKHLVKSSGHPSKNWPYPTLLNSTDRNRRGVTNVLRLNVMRCNGILKMNLHASVMILHSKVNIIGHFRIMWKILNCNCRHIAFSLSWKAYLQGFQDHPCIFILI